VGVKTAALETIVFTERKMITRAYTTASFGGVCCELPQMISQQCSFFKVCEKLAPREDFKCHR